MGKFLSPTEEQIQSAELKCAVIWYYSDDGLFFQQAVRGALADLRFPYKWEGENGLTSLIAEKFTETDLMTDKTFFVKDCETLSEALDEDGTMAINVTVEQNCGSGCGCGGGGNPSFPDYPNDTELTIPKVPIQPPTDDNPLEYPDGFSDRADYDEYKCAYATQLVDDFTESVGNLQVISGLVTTLSGAALISALFSATTYNAIVAGLVAAGISVTGGVVLIAGALAALVGFGAIAYDKFNDIFDELTLMRGDFICAVYNSSSIEAARTVFIERYGTAVTNLGLDDGLSAGLSNIVEGIVDALVPSEILLGLFELYKDFGTSDFDCSSCGAAFGTALFTFDADAEDWEFVIGRSGYVAGTQTIDSHPKSGNSPDPTTWRVQRDTINTKALVPAGSNVQVTALSLDVLQGPLGDFMANGKTVRVEILFADLTTWESPDITGYGNHALAGFPVKELQSEAGGNYAIQIKGYSNGSSANSDVSFDNVSITLDEV